MSSPDADAEQPYAYLTHELTGLPLVRMSRCPGTVAGPLDAARSSMMVRSQWDGRHVAARGAQPQTVLVLPCAPSLRGCQLSAPRGRIHPASRNRAGQAVVRGREGQAVVTHRRHDAVMKLFDTIMGAYAVGAALSAWIHRPAG